MDSTSTRVLIAILVMAVCVFIGALIALRLQNKKTNSEIRVQQKSGTKNYLIWIYRLYQRVPVLNRVFVKIKASVEHSYPADIVSINKKVSSILLRVTIIGGIGFTLALGLGAIDLYFLLVGATITFVGLNAYINYSVDKIDTQILRQFADFLTKLRHHYHENNMIDLAIYETLDEIPYEIRLHIQKIYDMLISPELTKKLEGYVGTEPNKFVLMFVSLCASIKEYGDKKLENGASLFLTDLNYLKEEVNNEIIGKRRVKTAFRGIPFWCLAPVVLMKPAQLWIMQQFEGIDEYYDGMMGIISLALIFVISLISYFIVTTLRDPDRGVEADSNIWMRIAAIEPISTYASKVVNKHYTKYKRFNDMLRGMGDRTGPKAFFVKRMTIGIATFVISTVILISGVTITRHTLLNTWKGAFENDMTPSDEYTQAMEECGREYAKIQRKAEVSDEEYKQQLVADIMENTTITNQTYAESVADKIIEKVGKYQDTYFRWWQLLIAIAFGIIGFMAPVWYLKFKRRLVDMRREEEVVRFQSIMLILMHINGTTLPIILEWMERFSYCFKESIAQCRVELPSGMQQALKNLKATETFEPFRDFTDNLLAIDRVGVAKAFDEIQTDREYYMKKREEDREESLSLKLKHAHRIMFVPLFSAIIFYMILPLGTWVAQYAAVMRDIV